VISDDFRLGKSLAFSIGKHVFGVPNFIPVGQEPTFPKQRIFLRASLLVCRISVGQESSPKNEIFRFGGQASGLPIFSCRVGFHTPPMNFLSARCKTAPYIKPIFQLSRKPTL